MILPRSTRALSKRLSRTQELTSDGPGRYIDFGARVICVRKDDRGAVLPGTNLPAVVTVKNKERLLGGRWDTISKSFVGPCINPRVWFVGEKQFDILCNPSAKQHNLLYSAEGAGKTVLMAQWLWAQVFAAALLGISGNIGATAPTSPRLGTLIQAVVDLAPIGTARESKPEQWGKIYVDAQDLKTVTGHTVQFRSTKKQSGATGSPIQGWNWGLGAACDELQDSIDSYADIVARLRAGKNAPIMGTATAKKSPSWRNFRDALSTNWQIHRLSFQDTPFIHDSHWAMMKEECSSREWQRRGLAMDVGPERMTYNTWERSANLHAIPQIGAEDVTEQVLSRYGANTRILVGHDPGASAQVSVLLKAYKLKNERRHRWYVVGEVTSKRATEEAHIIDLKRELHKFNCDPDQDYGRPVIKFDPTTTKDIYTLYRKARLVARPASFKTGTNKAATIAKESRIEMVCSLFCNALAERWLYVAADDRGRPVAPKTVESIELSERDAGYEAEKVRKGDTDITHWMAAAGYALWGEEKPQMKRAA